MINYTDLLKRLRSYFSAGLGYEAADAIEAQQAIIQRLRDSLEGTLIDKRKNEERLVTENARLRAALVSATEWIETECQPSAEFVGEGHNWNMSDDERLRATQIIEKARAALGGM